MIGNSAFNYFFGRKPICNYIIPWNDGIYNINY